MSESLITLQALRTPTLLKETPTQIFSREICKTFKNTLFYRLSPAAVSTGLRFPACNFLKRRLRQRCFSVNFTKILRTSIDRTSPDECSLCPCVFQSTSFIEHLISSTSYRISTTLYSKKLFHKYFSSILYKNK